MHAYLKYGFALKDGTKFYKKGETAEIKGDDLTKAIKDGEILYTSDTKQDSTTLAKNGTHYAYATKLYDEKGKEVSAENIAAGKMADGKTDATNGYFSNSAATTGVTNGTTVAIAKAKGVDFTESKEVNGAISFSLHVGADSASDNKIAVKIESMSAKGIGVEGLKVDTEDDATAAIDRISEAIQKVSSQRSTLGAAQNRLEHTISNLDNVVENTTSAESRIRDTDMAQEMVNYSKSNILAQAGQSMLAQANQSNQGVLSLLQ